MRNLWIALFLLILPRGNTAQRILFVGNSLTISRPAPDLGWGGLWGMAATQPDRDYAHRVQLMLTERQGAAPEIAIIGADLHRWQSASTEIARAAQRLKPDLVIVQMGEHATADTPYADFLAAYSQIAEWTPGARHIALGLWGGPSGDVRGINIERAAGETGMQYIAIRDLHIEENTATQYTNAAVAWHPNDQGMNFIAGRIVRGLQPVTWLPWITSSGNGTIPTGGTIP